MNVSLKRRSHWPDRRFRRHWSFSHRKIPKIPAGTVTAGVDQIYLRFLGRFLHRTSQSQGGEFSLLYTSNRSKNYLYKIDTSLGKRRAESKKWIISATREIAKISILQV